jgi:N5-(cytidine 5'-diphosphoramidyl)-L-glutamine hydrolase
VKIGITSRITNENPHNEIRDALSHDWFEYFNKIMPKAILIPIPNNHNNIKKWLEVLDLDLVILSNGNDIGEYVIRDDTENSVISFAVEACIPIIGFCRGFQLINIYFGGELTLNIIDTHEEKHINVDHQLIISDQAFIDLIGTRKIEVNSFHSHGIAYKDLASSLKIFASTEGGLVEGFIHNDLPIIGIQWHPERNNNASEENKIIINEFINNGKFW